MAYVTNIVDEIAALIRSTPFPRPADFWKHYFTAPAADGSVTFDPTLPQRVTLTAEQYAEIAAQFGGV